MPSDDAVRTSARDRAEPIVSGRGADERSAEGYLVAVADLQLVIPAESVAEILSKPREVTPVPATVGWLLGIAHYRGNLLPIFDLAGYIASLGGAAIDPKEAEPRILVVRHEELPFGLLIPKLLGNRRLGGLAARSETRHPGEGSPLGSWLVGSYEQDGRTVSLVDPDLLASALQGAVAAAETAQPPR